MAENRRLYQCYLLKEQAFDIFEERAEETALKRLDTWFKKAEKDALPTALAVEWF
jgi:hypothetical protein